MKRKKERNERMKEEDEKPLEIKRGR